MSITLWKDKDSKRANAKELINWLQSQSEGQGWRVEWRSTVAFAELISSASRPDLTQGTVMRVLDEMSKSNLTTVNDFERIFGQHLAESAKKHQQKHLWTFYLPLEMTLNSDLKSPVRIRILDRNFQLLQLSAVERRLGRANRGIFRNPANLYVLVGTTVKHIPQVFLVVSSEADTWRLAWESIVPTFDALRGIFELSLNYGGWRLNTGGKNPRRTIPHPLWMMFHKTNAPLEGTYFITDENKPSKLFDLSAKRFAAIKSYTKFLRQEVKADTTLSVIADCMRLYAQAMDAQYRHDCFLGFWQLAEAVTRSETVGGATDKVVARLAWHAKELGFKGSGFKESLIAFAKKRIDIVHKGIREGIEDDDINVLKLACEVALVWLVRERKAFPTTVHLDQFYRLREVNPSELKALRDCAVYALRKNKSP